MSGVKFHTENFELIMKIKLLETNLSFRIFEIFALYNTEG
jgi:hypothetical protein